MKQKFLIIGAGRFGRSVAKGLHEANHDVVVCDRNPNLLTEIQDFCHHPVGGDATEDSVLEELEVTEFDTIIVSIGDDFKSAAFIVGKLKELGCQHVVTKANDQFSGKLLYQIGANQVVFPEEESGERLARKLASPGMLEHMSIAPNLNMIEIKVPNSFIGQSLVDLNFRNKFRVTVVLVIRKGVSEPMIAFDPNEPFQAEDLLLVIGAEKDLEKLKRKSMES